MPATSNRAPGLANTRPRGSNRPSGRFEHRSMAFDVPAGTLNRLRPRHYDSKKDSHALIGLLVRDHG